MKVHVPDRISLMKQISSLQPASFERVALEVFEYQRANNALYNAYIRLIGKHAIQPRCLEEIPFIPISFFKHHAIQSGNWLPEATFSSSGTTGSSTSQHLLRETSWYRQTTFSGFQQFYGPVESYCFLALLPAYLERKGSSLVHMVHDFIVASKWPQSGFFLHDFTHLKDRLQDCIREKIPTVFLGVSFALLDFCESFSFPLQDVIVMETGGMKGRRTEMTRSELHSILKAAFNLETIHSEYGMTELLSQAYSKGNGLFYPANTMRVLISDITDPFQFLPDGQRGTIQVVDLGNLDTISFIATEDLGLKKSDGSFEIIGRLDYSDIRGCNLLHPV